MVDAPPPRLMTARFHDRNDAGRRLAAALRHFAHRADVVVLGLPRGGVPVAAQVARELGAPLDVFVVRKLGLPFNPELAMGALARGGVRVLDQNLIQTMGVSDDEVRRITADEQAELERREAAYRGSRAFPDVHGKTVILVDDGLATGASMRAAVSAIRQENPARVVVGVPVAAAETCDAFEQIVDEVVCVETPEPFTAVGVWYEDFSATTDEEIHDLLEHANATANQGPRG